MKKYFQNIAIVTFLIVAQIGAFALKSHAQATKDTVLLADETTLISAGNNAKIECDNDVVFAKLLQTWEQVIKRYSCAIKKDRHGEYKHYVLYVNSQDANLIVNWAKTNL